MPHEEIIARRLAGASLPELAAEFNAGLGTMHRICAGVQIAAAVPKKPALLKRRCLNCRTMVELPKHLFLCETCRAYATKNG